MRIAVSGLALPSARHLHLLPLLRGMGVEGLELAPNHLWPDFPNGIDAKRLDAYRAAIEAVDMRIIGLHDLLPESGELGLFADFFDRRRTLERLALLSAICRDLGGRTLILEQRWRRGLIQSTAWLECREFLEELLPAIEQHGTVLCFAPLAPSRGDFCIKARECLTLASAIDHPAFGVHLSAGALMANDEMRHATFAPLKGALQHLHLDEPAPTDEASRPIDHGDLRCHLSAIGYAGWLSIVPAQAPAENPLAPLAERVAFIRRHYAGLGTSR